MGGHFFLLSYKGLRSDMLWAIAYFLITVSRCFILSANTSRKVCIVHILSSLFTGRMSNCQCNTARSQPGTIYELKYGKKQL